MTTLRMIVGRYQSGRGFTSACSASESDDLEKRSRPIGAPGSRGEPLGASRGPQDTTHSLQSDETLGRPLETQGGGSVGCRTAANASPSHKRVRTSLETLRYHSQSSTKLPQTSWSTWKAIETPNPRPGAPEKKCPFIQHVKVFGGSWVLRSVNLLSSTEYRHVFI